MLRIAQGLDVFNNPLLEAFQQADTINVYVMAAGAAQYSAVPAGANFVLIAVSGANDVYMQLGITAGLAVPASNITNGTAPELLPGSAGPYLRQTRGAATLGIATTSACNVMLAYFS
jgi:hypothetical protein